MAEAKAVRLTPAPVSALTPSQERLLTRMAQEGLLLYHLVTGDTYHLARRGTGKQIQKIEKLSRVAASKLIYHRRVALIERGTIQGGYPYQLYTTCKPPEEQDALPLHQGYDYITLPSGAALGHCMVCGAWHLPGDIVAVLTLEELLHYLHLCWQKETPESPLTYLLTKPGKPRSHQG